MRLTRQSEVALALLARCATEPDRRHRLADLAAVAATTRLHAARIAALLVRHGLLSSSRGRGGGLQLAPGAAAIPLANVLAVTQPNLLAPKRPGDPIPATGLPVLGAVLEASQAYAVRMLQRFTVQDLARPSKTSPMPCTGCSVLAAPAPNIPAKVDRPLFHDSVEKGVVLCGGETEVLVLLGRGGIRGRAIAPHVAGVGCLVA